ncbi:hypothetical protein ACFX1W_045940 [Malus domestica]
MAAYMRGFYGSTLRYKSVERTKLIGKHSLLGASGEISNFQELLRYLDDLVLYDNMWDDGTSLGPKEVHSYLNRVMYIRRNKFNPLWNSLVLGGVKNGQKYLGLNENLTFEEGVKLLEKCMRVLLYRDQSAVNKLQIAKITEGVTISQPYSLKTFGVSLLLKIRHWVLKYHMVVGRGPKAIEDSTETKPDGYGYMEMEVAAMVVGEAEEVVIMEAEAGEEVVTMEAEVGEEVVIMVVMAGEEAVKAAVVGGKVAVVRGKVAVAGEKAAKAMVEETKVRCLHQSLKGSTL